MPSFDDMLRASVFTAFDGWLPTPENINALPDPLRQYIHDLETRCDPAGEVRELTIARDTVVAQELELEELKAWKLDAETELVKAGVILGTQGRKLAGSSSGKVILLRWLL